MQNQKIPAPGPKRESLRQKGQFWTPSWIAEAMVGYVIHSKSNHIFDPAVGTGAFFNAAKAIARETGRHLYLLGIEADSAILRKAKSCGLSEEDLAYVQKRNFLNSFEDSLKDSFKAIVANPPYIRHHRLPIHVKQQLKAFGANLTGKPLDGRAGLHTYFLLRALQLLDKNGRLAFIMPSDICEGISSAFLWEWITKNYYLEAVVTFAPVATPFPKIDVNPIIFMIRNTKPFNYFLWARCSKSCTNSLKEWTLSRFKKINNNSLTVYKRRISEALSTGLSRVPNTRDISRLQLKDFAKVLRGIATGDNDFFFLTPDKAKSLRIPNEFLIPAIGRTRDIVGDRITSDTLKELDAKGRPTLLFSPDARPIEQFPKTVQEYLKRGEEKGVHKKPLIATRSPWYKMEVRSIPPILFAYLGRRNCRFIRNYAGVVPLTGFLCVYPKHEDQGFVENLYKKLQNSLMLGNLELIGKSYGAGAIKVEPRALERLPLSQQLRLL